MLTERLSLTDRAARHAALADPLRLRVVDELTVGDLAPSEIQARLGVSSSLLAHHLDALEHAGLVERSRSEADRRRTYLRLTPGGRRAAVPAQIVAPGRVLFVCSGNSARSQLAAALWQRESGIPAASAGTRPALAVAPGAVEVARRRGLAFDGRTPTPLADVLADDDWIVSVCDAAHEWLGGRDAIHWSIPDPVRDGSRAAFDRAFDELSSRVAALVPSLITA